MPQEYEITVNYNEDDLSAMLTCPLCETEWRFPFPARQILEKPWPPPGMIVVFHLYGAGENPTPCPEFDRGGFIPYAEAIDDLSVKLRLELVRRQQV